MTMPAALATLIAEGRKAKGLDQGQFGQLFGDKRAGTRPILQTVISRVELGKALFPKGRLPELARILGVDLKKLRELHMQQERERLEEDQLLETLRHEGWRGVRRMAENRSAAL